MLVSLWIDLFAGLTAGSRFVSVCDAVGEKLAWWLGITSPKYYYEIQEAIRCKVSQSINWNNQPANQYCGAGAAKQDIYKPLTFEEYFKNFLSGAAWCRCRPSLSGAGADQKLAGSLPVSN